ncbi:MAG TPA: hypothetical protein DD440_07815 [Porticoccaceae bacterium]|mgnify:CR=1 FL=1|jgi:hypothetical protein|nr:hypothetical protein [Porticoccaceae bacterium]|tara:strand:- start:2053 stop:2289 length:237 start_codon:yes stop_codon:yes gene_type:complete
MTLPEKKSPKDALQSPKHSLMDVIKSVLWAALGVNSSKNREHDFDHGNPIAFILGGFAFTVAFICTIALIVGLVLRQS